MIDYCIYIIYYINRFEYNRENWTYHGKGMWCKRYNDFFPSIICLGSTNYGRRSYERDTETQLYIFTDEPKDIF